MKAPSRKRLPGTLLLGCIGTCLATYLLHLSSAPAGKDTSKTSAQVLTASIRSVVPQDARRKRDQRMAKYLEKYKYTAPDLTDSHIAECGATPEFAMFFQLPLQHRSRLNEDRILYERLFKKWEQFESSGTYVEMGAFDGHTESNSRFFDICLGWKGLLVEGNPGSYAKVLKARPHAHRMSFAPSCSAEYEVENKTIEFYKYPMANSGLIGQAITYKGKPTVDVPCGPLAPVLQDIFENERINFFSLDVEGAEPTILETIDFDKVMIEVMMIEVRNNHCTGNCESRQRVRAKMEKEGYRRYEQVVVASDIYIHPNSRYQFD